MTAPVKRRMPRGTGVRWHRETDPRWGTPLYYATIGDGGLRVAEAYSTGSRLDTARWRWKLLGSSASGEASVLFNAKVAAQIALEKGGAA